MKPITTIVFFAVASTFVSCSSISNPANGVNDDIYSKRRESNAKPKSVNDIEPWNKKKRGPQAEVIENRSAPATYATSNASSYTPDPYEAERAAEANRLWAQRRNMVTTNDSPIYEQNLVFQDEREDDRESRRMGTSRSRYYNDPYYDVLSQNWGWTNFYQPVTVFPGHFGFAPGFNVGLGWNNNFGWNNGFGFNSGWGHNPWNPYAGFGWNDPFFNPYDPYGGMGWGYNPWNPYGNMGWGYNPWNPYGGMGWGYNPWRRNWGWGGGCFNNRWGNDIVSNRPFMRPMNGIGSAIPSGNSRPAVPVPGGRSVRPSVPSPAVNQQGPDRPQQTARPTYNPNRPQAPQAESPRPNYTNKPGGDLIYDNQGRPSYVPPRRDRSTGDAPRQAAPTNNGTGEVRPSYGSPSPSRPRYNEPSSRPAAPSASPSRPAESRPSAPRQSTPSRPSAPAPSYSRPSAPAPSPSRPSASPPSPSRPSGGAAPSGGSFRRP